MSAISGQKTVTTAGTEVALGSQKVNCDLLIKALPANTGVMYIGNNGSDVVSSSTGYPLNAGDQVVLHVTDLADIMVDSTVNGEGVAWLMLEVESN